MRTHTAEDLEKDLDLLWLHEGEGLSQTDLAAQEGMSQGHLSRRLARARRYRAELEKLAAREQEPCDADEDKAIHLPLVDSVADAIRRSIDPDTGEERYTIRPHYNLSTDETPLDGANELVAVGGGPAPYADRTSRGSRCPEPPLAGQRLRYRRLYGGRPVEKTGNKSCKPDPDGLKGGVG